MCPATQMVCSWENRRGVELGGFVKLMCKSHDTEGPGQVSVIVHGEIVIDASEEGGDEVSEGIVVDSLEERGASRLVIVKVTLFGEEAIVHLKRVGEIKNTVVGPNEELDRKRGVKTSAVAFAVAASRVETLAYICPMSATSDATSQDALVDLPQLIVTCGS